MKNFIKLFFVCFIFAVSNFASSQSSWFWQNPLPQGNTLNCVKFVNSQTGFAAGNVGAIMESTNAGENWILYNSNFVNNLHSLSFTDDNTIYTCGSDGIILKTTNSGNSWNIISSGTIDTLLSIFFTDANTGYACGKAGRIIKTTDAGNNWTQQTSGVINNLNNVFFLNADKGFICGSERILKTANGGINWSVSTFSGSIYNAICFINDNTGFAAGGSFNREFRKTINGGNTWVPFFIAPSGPIRSIQFINQTTGFMSGSTNSFFKTTDGGNNWNFDNTISADGFSLSSVYFPNTTEGYLVGTYGTVFKSTDTGNNWTAKAPQGTLDDLWQITFASKNTGYIIGKPFLPNSIYKTTNSGNNWIALSSPFQYINKIQFLNDLTGYIESDLKLYKTQNGANTWNVINIPSDTAIGFEFVDESTGFYSSTFIGSDLYKTTNGGDSWILISLNPDKITKFQFPLHDVGYMITINGVNSRFELFKSTTTGNTWNHVKTFDFQIDLRFLYFINENTGFVFSEELVLPMNVKYSLNRTTDGGLNWQKVYETGILPFGWEFFNPKIKFINKNTGFITGVFPENLLTTTQGEEWNIFNAAGRSINDIEFTDDNTGYFIGPGGMIKKTTTGGVIAIEDISSFIPDEFSLEQNYPNPFNPNTVISYQLKISSFISLKVYDLLGKEVATLINEKQSAGIHSVDFNGSNLPSGIYFYKIETVNYSETRKMILLK
ncbi:MAG: YCF48-related protein [Bacteroidota bacterium]|nr:YCF48-related protein [Bacteroidota bacterium]